MQLDEAYARCAEITKREARNFSYGIRLLPPPKRRAMSALYALARRIDDIGDGDLPPDEKLAALGQVRGELYALRDQGPTAVDPTDPVFVAVAHAARQYPIPLHAFDDLIEGSELDCKGATYETADDLVRYCRLVAGSVGRLSLGVFGTNDPDTATPLADDLGVALQLTNILRDIVEDRGMGRVYLPADDRRRFDVNEDVSGPRAAVADLVRFECERAQTWFDRGLRLLPLLDRRSRSCVAAMAGIYHRLLRRIERNPAAVLDGRLSLPTKEKLWVAARSVAGKSS